MKFSPLRLAYKALADLPVAPSPAIPFLSLLTFFHFLIQEMFSITTGLFADGCSLYQDTVPPSCLAHIYILHVRSLPKS